MPSLFQQQYTPTFLCWYAIYPRKVAKRAAFKAYLQALKRGYTPEKLLQGCKRYAAECQCQPPNFIKHPATWLNADCADDEPLIIQKPEFESARSRRPAFKASDYETPGIPTGKIKSVGEILATHFQRKP